MEFLLPKFISVTHTTNLEEVANSKSYPTSNAFLIKRDYAIPKGVGLAVVEENLGFGCSWSEFVVVDPAYASAEYYNKRIFIPNNQVKNVSNKETFTAVCSVENQPDKSAVQVDPATKQTYVPYVDEYNGFYSVRVQVDQEKVIDSFIFSNLLEEVYLEGVQILLDSRGYRSDNDTINSLRNNYNTFAYVHNDLDLTVSRFCEPLTFTVSIPLRFFNAFESATEMPDETISPQIDKKLILINKTFNSTLDRLVRCISSKSGDFLQLTYPNKFIEGFVLDFEIVSLKEFAIAFNQLTSIIGYPLNKREVVEYEIDFDKNLNILGITVFSEQTEIKLNKSTLAQFRTRGEFNSKRIFNYLLNLEGITSDIVTIEAIDFIRKYVNYPQARIVENKITINGKTLTEQQVSNFKLASSAASEACLNLSDIALGVNAGATFTDTIYHLFVAQEGQKTGISTIVGDLKNSFATWEKQKTDIEKDSKNIQIQILEGASESFNAIREKYQFNLNTALYVLNRLNLNKILFQLLVCQAGASPETAGLLARLPQDILNYLQYVNSIKNLKGTEYVKALSAGLNFDVRLYCSKNADIIYFVKGLIKFVRALNVVGATIINANDTFNSLSSPSVNPYKSLTQSVINSVESLTVNLIFDLLRDVLTTTCEDDLYESNNNNYQNPFNTHQAIPRFGGQQDTDPQTLRNNRLSSLKNSFLNPVQYGLDEEYTVDLINLLLNDVNCLLTLQESIELLRGEPTDLVVALITNLIRNKYSSPPNDLSYLISNTQQLKLFFRELGLTVNDFVTRAETILVEAPSVVSLSCDPERLRLREEVINNKIPKDLGVLQRQLANRSNKAQKLFEYIQSGGVTEIDISPLCPDLEDEDIVAAKENIVENYRNYLESVFSNTVSAFTSEADALTTTLTEEKVFYRRDDDDLIDFVTYNTYNGDLFVSEEDFSSTVENGSYTEYSVKFKPRSLVNSSQESLEFLLGATPQEQLNIVCFDQQFAINPSFEAFLKNEGIYIEFANIDQFFESSDDLGTDLQDSRTATDDSLASILKNKKHFYSIVLNYETFQADYVYFNFYYNDKYLNKYNNLSSKQFQGRLQGDTSYTSTQFRDNLNANKDSFEVPSPNKHPDIYILREDTFNLLGIKEKQLIQGIYVQYFQKFIENEQKYEKLSDQINKLQENGIFNITSKVSQDKFEKTINLITVDQNGDIIQKPFLKYDRLIDFNFNQAISTQNFGQFGNKIDLVNTSFFYQFLLNNKYIKLNADLFKDFIYSEDGERKSPEDSDEAKNFMSNKDIVVQPDFTGNEYTNRFSKLKLFNITQTIEQKNCNIFPHYLNLSYFIQITMNDTVTGLCETNLDTALNDSLDSIIVNLTTRAYVADLLLKAIPFLSCLNKVDFNTLYSNKNIVNIIKKFIEQEMSVFSPTPQTSNLYYKYFIKKVNNVYDQYRVKRRLSPKFNTFEIQTEEDKLNYFISKEIAVFTKFCNKNDIISLSEESIIQKMQNYVANKQDLIFLRDFNEETYKFLIQEFETVFAFTIMVNTVDAQKRSIFMDTKSELAKIFSKTVQMSPQDESQSSFTDQEKQQEDIEKFLMNLAYSPAPATSIFLKPQYSKYIKFFLNALVASNRQFLLDLSQNGDKNIKLTRLINKLLTVAGSLSWGLLDQTTRTNLILQSNTALSAFTYKRLEDGRSISPDAVTSLSVAATSLFTILPDYPGYAYLVLDTIQETQYYYDSIREIQEMKRLSVDSDPCESASSDANAAQDQQQCSLEGRQQLLSRFNEHENP